MTFRGPIAVSTVIEATVSVAPQIPERRLIMKFPKKIYVSWMSSDDGSGDPWMEVNTKIEHLDENFDKIAIYELKEVKTLKVTRELK
jgi:hypothetical protein